MEHFTQMVISFIDHYGYDGLLVVMALGNIGAPIGSEVVLPTAGALTATHHLPFIWATIVVAVAGELIGGTIGYAIGRFGGRPLVDNFGKYVHLTHENLDRVHRFFEKYGPFSIFICRFIPVIRGIVSIPAGLAAMDLAPFYLWYALGSIGFCGALIGIGYELGDHVDSLTPLLHKGGYVAAAVAVLVMIGIVVVVRRRNHAANT